MDYVYVCRAGDNEELRYSIRSVAKNAPMGRVWLVGGKPEWYSGDFLPVKNIGGKFNNIRACIAAAAKHEDIADDIVLMNDDFFFMQKIDKIPTYYSGTLLDRSKSHQEFFGPNLYANLLSKTNSRLRKVGIEMPLNYDVHVPMPMSKAKLAEIVDEPLATMSYYGNIAGVGGEDIRDVKVYDRYTTLSYDMNNKSIPYVSTEDGSFETALGDTIKEMFPEPSKYEYP